MLTPRLTECSECANINKLLADIDCKLAELSVTMYNNTVFMLNNKNSSNIINKLLHYKRILQYKFYNCEYACKFSVNQIASKILKFLLGCNVNCNCNQTGDGVITTTTSSSSTTTTTTTNLCPNCVLGTETIIDTQTWSSCNLQVSNYKNGDPIPQVTDPIAWANLTTGAWSYYNNDSANEAIYGKLYNWYAVNDPRGLAPTGYHIPADVEFTLLTNFLGGESISGGKLKEQGLCHWNFPNTGAINNTNFTGLPGGTRTETGIFTAIKNFGGWWSSTELSLFAWARYLDFNTNSVDRVSNFKSVGFSVRVIKDVTPTTTTTTTTIPLTTTTSSTSTTSTSTSTTTTSSTSTSTSTSTSSTTTTTTTSAPLPEGTIVVTNNISVGSGQTLNSLSDISWTTLDLSDFPIPQSTNRFGGHFGYSGSFTITATTTSVDANINITKNGVLYFCISVLGSGTNNYVFPSVVFAPTDDVVITLNTGECI